MSQRNYHQMYSNREKSITLEVKADDDGNQVWSMYIDYYNSEVIEAFIERKLIASSWYDQPEPLAFSRLEEAREFIAYHFPNWDDSRSLLASWPSWVDEQGIVVSRMRKDSLWHAEISEDSPLIQNAAAVGLNARHIVASGKTQQAARNQLQENLNTAMTRYKKSLRLRWFGYESCRTSARREKQIAKNA